MSAILAARGLTVRYGPVVALEELDVEVVEDLLVEGFGDGARTYEELLRHDARRIAQALAR